MFESSLEDEVIVQKIEELLNNILKPANEADRYENKVWAIWVKDPGNNDGAFTVYVTNMTRSSKAAAAYAQALKSGIKKDVGCLLYTEQNGNKSTLSPIYIVQRVMDITPQRKVLLISKDGGTEPDSVTPAGIYDIYIEPPLTGSVSAP